MDGEPVAISPKKLTLPKVKGHYNKTPSGGSDGNATPNNITSRLDRRPRHKPFAAKVADGAGNLRHSGLNRIIKAIKQLCVEIGKLIGKPIMDTPMIAKPKKNHRTAPIAMNNVSTAPPSTGKAPASTGKMNFHHYNPNAWHGSGSAVVLPNGTKADKVTLNGEPLKLHGALDKGRQVWTDYNTPGKSGRLEITVGGKTFAHNVSSSGMQFG